MNAFEVRLRGQNHTHQQSVSEADSQLLLRFISEQNQAAFETLMHRHGRMVMGVCRRVLDDPQHAEDAYQTTFLMLVQKRAAIKNPDRLASWLYGVAYRIAVRIRTKTAQRAKCEMARRRTPQQDPTLQVAWQELRSVLDEEISRLPEKHRIPLILCYLEEKTNAEAAHELGLPKGSMSGRLAKAREMLRRRLVRRGMTFSAPFFAMLLAENAMGETLPTAMVAETMRAVMSTVAGNATAANDYSSCVARQVPDKRQMLLSKPRYAAAILLFLLPLVGVTARQGAVREHGSHLINPSGPAESDSVDRESPSQKTAFTATPRRIRADQGTSQPKYHAHALSCSSGAENGL